MKNWQSGLNMKASRNLFLFAFIGAFLGFFSFADNCYATPAIPTGLTSTGSTTTSIDMDWNSVSNCPESGDTYCHYQLRRNGVQVYSNSATSYTDTGLTCGTSYGYDVRVCSGQTGGWDCSLWSSPLVNRSTSACPGTPAAPTVTSPREKSVIISYSAPSDCPDCQYQIKRNDGQMYYPRDETSYTDTNTTCRNTYSYQVRGCANGVTCGSWSSASSAIRPPCNQPVVLWGAVAENVNDQGNVLIRGYAYDPPDSPADVEENVTVDVFIAGQNIGLPVLSMPWNSELVRKRFFLSTYTGNYSGDGDAPCEGLNGRCAFSYALNAGNFSSGNTYFIEIKALDNDTLAWNSSCPSCSNSLTYQEQGCSGDYKEMKIDAYTFNRPHQDQIWRGCVGYNRTVVAFENYPSRFFGFSDYDTWPEAWAPIKNGNFYEALNKGIKDHHLGGVSNAYTLGMYKYSGNESCVYVAQDYADRIDIINDNYRGGYKDDPLCANLTTANGTKTITIAPGESTTLTWTTSGAKKVKLDNVYVEANNPSWTTPALNANKTYTLTSYLTDPAIPGANPLTIYSSVTINVDAGSSCTPSYDCNEADCGNQCGTTLNQTCTETTSSCDVNTVGASVCRDHGIPCEDSIDCPACPADGDRKWIEVVPS